MSDGIGARRVLHPGKLKWSFVSLIGLTFVVMGVFLIFEGEGMMAWLVTGFFGLTAGVGLLQLTGIGSRLTLDADGFEVVTLGRGSGFVRWDECSGFAVVRVGRNEMIAYDKVSDGESMMNRANRALAGGASAVPDTYGMKGKELAELMNAYREKALTSKG